MLDVQHLPYRSDVLELLAERRSDGWRIVLATAAARTVAEEIANELQVFDDVLATEGAHNLKGAAKLAAIQRYCESRQVKSFAYIGDSRADLAIWKEAEHVYVAAPSPRLNASIRELDKPVSNLGDRPSIVRATLRALRPKQWVKNLLLFVPLIMAHEILEWPKVLLAVLAVVAFSFCASSIYVLNDLMDLQRRPAPPDQAPPALRGRHRSVVARSARFRRTGDRRIGRSGDDAPAALLGGPACLLSRHVVLHLACQERSGGRRDPVGRPLYDSRHRGRAGNGCARFAMADRVLDVRVLVAGFRQAKFRARSLAPMAARRPAGAPIWRAISASYRVSDRQADTWPSWCSRFT